MNFLNRFLVLSSLIPIPLVQFVKVIVIHSYKIPSEFTQAHKSPKMGQISMGLVVLLIESLIESDSVCICRDLQSLGETADSPESNPGNAQKMPFLQSFVDSFLEQLVQ